MRVSLKYFLLREIRDQKISGARSCIQFFILQMGKLRPTKGEDFAPRPLHSLNQPGWVLGSVKCCLRALRHGLCVSFPARSGHQIPISSFPLATAVRCGILPHEVLLWHMLPKAWSGDPEESFICTQPVSHRAGEQLWLFPGDHISELSASKEAFLWPASLSRPMAGGSGAQPTPIEGR